MKYRSLYLFCFLILACPAFAAPVGNYGTYQIHSGDTLQSIAHQYGTDSQTLIHLNHVQSATNLKVGEVLIVPNTSKSATPTVAKPQTSPKQAPKVVSTQKQKTQVDSQRLFLEDYQDPQDKKAQPSIWSIILDLFVKLAIVLTVAYFALVLLRKYMSKQMPVPGRGRILQVIESTSLGPGKALHLVKMGDKYFVVGCTSNQITTLSDITDPELLQALTEKSSTPPINFASTLNKVITRSDTPQIAVQVKDSARYLWDKVQKMRNSGQRKGDSR